MDVGSIELVAALRYLGLVHQWNYNSTVTKICLKAMSARNDVDNSLAASDRNLPHGLLNGV